MATPSLGLTVFGVGTGHTRMAFIPKGAIFLDVTGCQAEMMQRVISLALVKPAPVKPAFRGRRHGW